MTAQELLTEIPPLMLACCDGIAIRYDLKKPFPVGHYLWATNGRILVRQPIDDFAHELISELRKNRGSLPRPLEVWSHYPVAGEEQELPMPIRTVCPECKGVERVECYECHGVRSELNDKPVPVGDLTLGSYYAALLYDHGIRGVKVAGPSDAVQFSLGRLEGMLMPLNPETKD